MVVKKPPPTSEPSGGISRGGKRKASMGKNITLSASKKKAKTVSLATLKRSKGVHGKYKKK
jgi:hypothetical protein